MKKIYITTGADGFPGSDVVRLLQTEEDAEIRAMKYPDSKAQSLFGLKCLTFTADVLDRPFMEPVFDVPADAQVFVIHCAGIVDIGKACSINEYSADGLVQKRRHVL